MAVVSLEIKKQRDFANRMAFGEVGSYQQLEGTVHFAVDPDSPIDAIITDLKRSPRDARGMVCSSADFLIIQPTIPSLGRHRILFDVVNRGNPMALTNINSGTGRLDPGTGFLMREGYTVVWCGWQYDVPDVEGISRIDVPEAVTEDGKPIIGKMSVAFQTQSHVQVNTLSDRLHRPHPTRDVNDPEAVLLVREHESGPSQTIPWDKWSFARLEGERVIPDDSHVYMESGFEPGKIYEVVYTTIGAPIVGLGLLAPRDLVSFLKNASTEQGNPCAGDIEFAYAFGRSQSAMFLREFLYLGLNQDEENRVVFDGLIPLVAGGGRGTFINQRFGQPSPGPKAGMGGQFPFHDTVQTDPETGLTEGLLACLRAKGNVPKIFFINTSAEYWWGSAALIHTSPDGKRDLQPSENVRVYHYAGNAHIPGKMTLAEVNLSAFSLGQHPTNTVDYRPLLRAALVNLDRWVSLGEEPPPSCHPRLDDGTAVSPETIESTIRAIPGANFPEHLRYVYRVDLGPQVGEGIVTNVPPVLGKAYPCYVPAVDKDGNELVGIRLPDVTVPLATHAGWNLRHPDHGAPGLMMALAGSSVPFQATKAERESLADPRPSVEERYPDKNVYLSHVREAAKSLVDQGYLMLEDVEKVMAQSSESYDALMVVRGDEPELANNE